MVHTHTPVHTSCTESCSETQNSSTVPRTWHVAGTQGMWALVSSLPIFILLLKRAGHVMNTKCRFCDICFKTVCGAEPFQGALESCAWWEHLPGCSPRVCMFFNALSVFLIRRKNRYLRVVFYCYYYLYLNMCRPDVLGICISYSCVNLKIGFSKNEKFAKLPHLKPLLSTPSLTQHNLSVTALICMCI